MKKTESKKIIKIIMTILVFISIISSLFAIYEILLLSSIEDLIRYIVIGIFVILDIIILFVFFKKRKKKKSIKIFIYLMIIYSLITLLVGGVIYYFYGKVNSLNKNYITYTTDLITLSSSSISKPQDISDGVIGILGDKKNPGDLNLNSSVVKMIMKLKNMMIILL